MVVCLLWPLTMFAQASNEKASVHRVLKVEGTSLSTLHTLYDLLNQWAEVEASTHGVVVAGKGTPAIYIDNRLLIELSELSQIPASAIRQVELNMQPGAEYAKGTQAVIVIRLLKQKDEGFHLNNNLTLAATQWLSVSDELNLNYKRKRLTLDVMGLWNMNHFRSYGEDYLQRYKDAPDGSKILNYRSIIAGHYETDIRQAAGGMRLGYQLSEEHRLNVGYDFRTHVRNHVYDEDKIKYEYWEDKKGEMHLDVPDSISPNNVFKDRPIRRHTITVDYTGHWADWSLSVGNTTFFELAETHNDTYTPQLFSQLKYDRDEKNVRSYAQMNRTTETGKISFGLEHLLSGMEVLWDDMLKKDDRIHTNINEHILSAFGNINHSWGHFTLSAGVRYEHIHYDYKPKDDDEIVKTSGRNLHVTMQGNRLFPNLTLTYKQGSNEWSLLHSQSYRMPYKGYSRVDVSSVTEPENALLKTERIFTTGVEYKRNWLMLSATHNYYRDPVCSTTSSNRNFTGESYHALVFRMNVTPEIGWWSPRLSTTVHKQWMRMDTASKRDNLKGVRVTVKWFNTFHLPNAWQFRFNGEFTSQGADRNIHYRKNAILLAMAIQKDLLKNRLSLELSADNLFDLYETNRTIYRPTNSSEGSNDKVAHPVVLSVRYKL